MSWLAIIALLGADGTRITLRVPVTDEAACHRALAYWADAPRHSRLRWHFVAGSCRAARPEEMR